MAETKEKELDYEQVNGGQVVRLKAWPKPILGADGKPKRHEPAKPAPAPKTPAKAPA